MPKRKKEILNKINQTVIKKSLIDLHLSKFIPKIDFVTQNPLETILYWEYAKKLWKHTHCSLCVEEDNKFESFFFLPVSCLCHTSRGLKYLQLCKVEKNAQKTRQKFWKEMKNQRKINRKKEHLKLFPSNTGACYWIFFFFYQDKFASTGFMGIAAIVQNFVFSNCGQIVRTASEKATVALYNSHWHQLKRVDQRKMILLMLTHSQKEVGFIAGGFPVSLELFMNVSSYGGLLMKLYGRSGGDWWVIII